MAKRRRKTPPPQSSETSADTRARANNETKDIGDVDPAYKAHLKEPFLIQYRQLRAIGAAAEYVGVTQRTIKNWRNTDPNFREKFEEVDTFITDELKSSTLSRAIVGVPQPGPDGKIRVEFSDSLAALHLKQRDPSFRERVQIDVAIKAVHTVTGQIVQIIRQAIPEACPHCNRLLGLSKKLVSELEAMSKNLGPVE